MVKSLFKKRLGKERLGFFLFAKEESLGLIGKVL